MITGRKTGQDFSPDQFFMRSTTAPEPRAASDLNVFLNDDEATPTVKIHRDVIADNFTPETLEAFLLEGTDDDQG